MKRVILLAFLMAAYAQAYCTHIVGGFMSYTWVSGNTYNVTLTVYRDCNSSTPFDGTSGSTVSSVLAVFDNNGNLITSDPLPYPVITSVQPPINNPCLQITTNVCVEQGVYTFQITLPNGNSGYTLAYERCCRNGSINNVFDPGNQGAVYSAYIPPSTVYHNTSPVFNNFPPIFICVNSALVFNHSATDADGDVLRYSLCTPFNGGSSNDPAPNPPLSPPFSNIPWQSPYSTSDLLGGIPLSIDSITGVLTGTPNTVGQFVVGVCVSEYRNGQFIGSYLRDFQFNVTQCNIPAANIPSTNINPATGIGLYVLQCNNYTVTFQNNTYNPPPANTPLVYQWDFGVPGVNDDTSGLQYPTYTFPDTGTYLVQLIAIKGTSSSPCTDTTYAYVKVYPTFNADFVTANVCQSVSASFADSTTSTYGTTNRWIWSFGDGATSTLQNPTHKYTSAGTYTVTLYDKNTLGCNDTVQKSITIYPAPSPTFTYGPACINSPVNYTNTTNGAVSYSWDFGAGGPSSTLQNPVYTYSTAGNYTVMLTATSSNGCTDSASQTVTVHNLPVIDISRDTTICPFTSAQLYAHGGTTYLWTPATNLNDSSSANPIATPPPPNSVTYAVMVTDQFQCVNIDSVTISFHPVPHIDAGMDTSVCLNPGSYRDSVQLHASGGVSYQWSPATGLTATNIANPTSRPPGNITYYVLGTDVNGCQVSDSVKVYVLDPALNLILENALNICQHDTAHATIANQGVLGYTWTPNQYLTHPASFNTGFYPPDTTYYILTVSNYCYTKSDSLLIGVWPLPNLGLNLLDSICTGDSIQLTAHNAVTYQWEANPTLSSTTIANPVASPTVDTKYVVTGTSQYGCVNRDSTYILVYAPSPIQLRPDTPYICQGTSIQLHATGAYVYVWSPSGSLNTPNVSNPVATPMDTTIYNVVATNVHGCKTYDSLKINVQKPVVAQVQSPYNVCKGNPVQLISSGGLYYLWTPTKGLNNPYTNNPFATPDSSIDYIVKVSNDCFSDTAIAQVFIHQLPVVDAGPDTTIWRDTYAELHGYATETNHFWNPSTWLQDAFNLNTTASPPQTTWYELFAIDAYGCLNKDSVLITVVPFNVMDIPTGFSPNGDGVNDVFHIVRHLNISHLKEFIVYNRWGERVFSTDNITQGWDGTFNGQPQPLGVYTWLVIAVTKDGEEIVRKGNVTLVR